MIALLSYVSKNQMFDSSSIQSSIVKASPRYISPIQSNGYLCDEYHI